MGDQSGRFERGMWVANETSGTENKQPEMTVNNLEKPIEQRVEEIIGDMNQDIDGVLQLTRDLLTTEEGHRYIEQMIDHAGNVLEKAFSDFFRRSPDTGRDRPESVDKTEDKTGKNTE